MIQYFQFSLLIVDKWWYGIRWILFRIQVVGFGWKIESLDSEAKILKIWNSEIMKTSKYLYSEFRNQKPIIRGSRILRILKFQEFNDSRDFGVQNSEFKSQYSEFWILKASRIREILKTPILLNSKLPGFRRQISKIKNSKKN